MLSALWSPSRYVIVGVDRWSGLDQEMDGLGL